MSIRAQWVKYEVGIPVSHEIGNCVCVLRSPATRDLSMWCRSLCVHFRVRDLFFVPMSFRFIFASACLCVCCFFRFAQFSLWCKLRDSCALPLSRTVFIVHARVTRQIWTSAGYCRLAGILSSEKLQTLHFCHKMRHHTAAWIMIIVMAHISYARMVQIKMSTVSGKPQQLLIA